MSGAAFFFGIAIASALVSAYFWGRHNGYKQGLALGESIGWDRGRVAGISEYGAMRRSSGSEQTATDGGGR